VRREYSLACGSKVPDRSPYAVSSSFILYFDVSLYERNIEIQEEVKVPLRQRHLADRVNPIQSQALLVAVE
jgi:hypothetical protein